MWHKDGDSWRRHDGVVVKLEPFGNVFGYTVWRFGIAISQPVNGKKGSYPTRYKTPEAAMMAADKRWPVKPK